MEPHLERLLEELAAAGREHDAGEPEHGRRMLNITPETGRFLAILVKATRARAILEVGTSNGYSTIWLAFGARATSGRVSTIERQPAKVALARANLARAGVSELVDLREGAASGILAELAGPFDFVFLDADRPSYLEYLDVVFPKLAPGGLIVADNAVSHADEMAAYLAAVRSHPGLESVTVPIGNGEEISNKPR